VRKDTRNLIKDPSIHVYSIQELLIGPDEFLEKKKNKVEGVSYEMGVFDRYGQYGYEQVIPVIASCENLKYLKIIVPKNYSDRETKLMDSTLQSIESLVNLDIEFDSLSVLPSFVNENPYVKGIRYWGNYVKKVPRDVISSDSLEIVRLFFRVKEFNVDWKLCSNIRILSLFLYNYSQFPDLTPLRRLKKVYFYSRELLELRLDYFASPYLEYITIRAPKLQSLKGYFKDSINLESFSLESYYLNSLPLGLGNMSNLRRISIYSYNNIHSIDAIKNMNSLEYLSIDGINPVSVEEEISSLPNLDKLSFCISSLEGVDISKLDYLNNLGLKEINVSSSCKKIGQEGNVIDISLKEPVKDSIKKQLNQVLRKYGPF
jgi:hypothetical protein